jgi:8-oxo-dGTP pyrophosphatase MutT (NUDIX family)
MAPYHGAEPTPGPLDKQASLFRRKRVDWMENLDRPVTDLGNPLHVIDHLKSDHGWSQEAFENMSRNENWQKTHNRLHREGVPGLTDEQGMHFHGMRKKAEHWVECDQGHEHWGPHGAAGMLIRHHDPDDGETRYLLQRRAPWVDHGGTWGIPGGAMEHDEEPMEAAHRESEEEMGDLPHDLKHHKTHTDDHGGWAYHTVVMDSPHQFDPEGGEDDESRGHGWFTREEMERMSLHPGFAHTLHKVAMRKGAPFAGYEDFEECEERNADKEDPSAYCGEIKHRVEGRLRTLADLSDEDIQKGLGLPTAEQGHQDVVKEKGKALAEGLMAPFYEPYGGYEGYQLHQQNEGMMDLHRRYEGGSGKFGFDEDSDPYYQVHHKTPEGRLSGWSIKHYSDGPNATIHHEATGPEEAHELFDIGEDTYSPDKGGLGRHVQPPSRFGHKELEDTLKHWVEGPEEETGGARDYLEKNDPRIKRWKQR